jgi:two-component system, chemotaxis family, sensor kinase CheA
MIFSHFEYILDVVIIFNEKREITYFNSATATLLDMSPRRISKVNYLYELINLKNEKVFLMENGTEGKDEELKLTEIEFTTKKGKSGTGLVSIKKMEKGEGDSDSEEDLWVTVIRDISLEVSLHDKYQEKLREMEAANEKLEEYSRDLEKMVEKRTVELKKAHDFQRAMVNSLDQGLMVFDVENDCHPSFTNACLDLFPSSPDGAKIYDVLGFNEKAIDDFKKWSTCVFSNILPFDDAARLGPKFVEINEGEYRYVSLEYYPMYDDEEKIHSIVMVGTDKTEEVKAKRLLEEKNSYVNMVTKILSNKKQFLVFYRDFMVCMDYLKTIDFENKKNFQKEKIEITLHSMKGSCSVYAMTILAKAIHKAEDLFSKYLENNDEDAIDQFELMIDEIEKISNFNFEEATKFVGGSSLAIEDERIDIKVTDLLGFRNKLVEYGAVKIAKYFSNEFLMTPIGVYFSGYNDLVHDLADELEKEVAPMTFENEDIKINTEGFDEFFNALPHLFRNCVYHGIENPEIREEKSKDSKGHIDVKFDLTKEESKRHLKIVVTDDGAGINVDKIREKLIENGHDGAGEMTEDALVYQIFSPNMSTADAVDEVAGRGVGMHAVKVAVDNLNGNINVETTKNEGTVFTFKLPLAS